MLWRYADERYGGGVAEKIVNISIVEAIKVIINMVLQSRNMGCNKNDL